MLDVSVLLLFFNRADHFSQVWAQVKKARPARLFLYQDGPREGRDDMPGILECRALVADDQIDWPCEVHRNYQEKNVGCDPAEYLSQRWAFSLTDKCIVLEDDDVPSQSFFTFCKEMLDRYEHDERITLISGFMTRKPKATRGKAGKAADGQSVGNTSVVQSEGATSGGMLHEGEASYFFTRAFSIWGWASWARVVNNWEGDYAFLDDPKRLELLRTKVKQYGQRNDMVQMCLNHRATGKEYYESIFWAYMLLHDGLAIMPEVALIDGNRAKDFGIPVKTVVKGDSLSANIAAASILAKVTRDDRMLEYAKEYPQYGFEIHKGYGTRAHYDALRANGASPIHRRTFLRKFYAQQP